MSVTKLSPDNENRMFPDQPRICSPYAVGVLVVLMAHPGSTTHTIRALTTPHGSPPLASLQLFTAHVEITRMFGFSEPQMDRGTTIYALDAHSPGPANLKMRARRKSRTNA